MKQTLLQLDEETNSKVLEIAREMKYNKSDTLCNLIKRGIAQYETDKKNTVEEEYTIENEKSKEVVEEAKEEVKEEVKENLYNKNAEENKVEE